MVLARAPTAWHLAGMSTDIELEVPAERHRTLKTVRKAGKAPVTFACPGDFWIP